MSIVQRTDITGTDFTLLLRLPVRGKCTHLPEHAATLIPASEQEVQRVHGVTGAAAYRKENVKKTHLSVAFICHVKTGKCHEDPPDVTRNACVAGIVVDHLYMEL